ncbi:MAG TPA: deoxyribodipyrimidine photo-lyase [Candidatus Baltobacteraceae bacterium]|nr:deoxyribodipyrimidine photo-lyase [Candidatus Baltobacteraceae bacterium]
MPVAIHRFLRDLRLDDHAGLATAASHGEVLPVLVVDRALQARIGASPRRAAFYCGAVAALDAALRERGSRLLVRRGNAGPVLRQLARASGAQTVTWSASFDRAGMQADQQLQSDLEEAGLRALLIADAPALAPEETTAARPSAGDGYRAFVPYHEVWRELEPASYEAPLLLTFAHGDLQSEALPQPADFDAAVAPMETGAAHAARRFESFLQSDGLQYAFATNQPADDRTSHLGADLSFGTIAARTIVRETRRRMDDPFLLAEERNSLKLFLRSMAMRDFFLQLSWYNPQTDRRPLQEKMREFMFARTHEALFAWRTGRTGFPLVDAGIRQMHETGWMHPRVRAIAASFLCFDLGVDWRVGLDEWERHLIEDDPALAIGNWQWVAGVGADLAAYPRIYNPVKQARRFDPLGVYARTWIEELSNLPAGAIAARVSTTQIELPLYGGQPYPQPVIDHDRAARDFLAKYQEFMQAYDRQANR